MAKVVTFRLYETHMGNLFLTVNNFYISWFDAPRQEWIDYTHPFEGVTFSDDTLLEEWEEIQDDED